MLEFDPDNCFKQNINRILSQDSFLNLIISLDVIDLYQMVFLKGYMNLIMYCQLAATEKEKKKEMEKEEE